LFFRADEETIPQFEAEGSQPFSYQTSTRSVTVASYWQLPARLFDDTEELGAWARAALGAAQRAALKKRARKPRKAKTVQVKKAQAGESRATAAKPAKRSAKPPTSKVRATGKKKPLAAKASMKRPQARNARTSAK
jgi:DNA transformation protein